MGRNKFHFKPPYFPKFDSIAPSVIYEGNSNILIYSRAILHATLAVVVTISCLMFALTVHARIVFGLTVHECMGTIGEINNSNDHSVSVVVPQITMGIFILTFIVVINGYNLLIQFLIVLCILESLTFLVWKHEFPYGSVELEYDDFFRIVTKRMIRCNVVKNKTIEACWRKFMHDYCPEWVDMELKLCHDSNVNMNSNSMGNNQDNSSIYIDGLAVGNSTYIAPVPAASTDNIIYCYDRFKMHPWSNVSREETYMNTVYPKTTTILIVHIFSVMIMYVIARIYVYENSRLRNKWIEELLTFHANLNAENQSKDSSRANSVTDIATTAYNNIDNSSSQLQQQQQQQLLEHSLLGACKIHKYLIWDMNKCDVCKEEMSLSHCFDWVTNPEEEEEEEEDLEMNGLDRRASALGGGSSAEGDSNNYVNREGNINELPV